MGMKKKVGTGVLAVALLAGGAVVGASSQSFGEYVDGATDSVFETVAGWAGYTVHSDGKDKEKAVASHVEKEFNEGMKDSADHFSTEVARGKSVVNDEYDAIIQEITKTTDQEVADVKGRITTEVDEEVESVKGDLNSAAINKAKSMLDQVKLPKAPDYK